MKKMVRKNIAITLIPLSVMAFNSLVNAQVLLERSSTPTESSAQKETDQAIENGKTKHKFLEPAKVEKVIRSKIAQLNVKQDLDLFDINLIDGVNVGGKYNYELSPAYYKNKFSRIDEWVMNASISPGTWLEDVDLPIGFSIGKGAKVTFARLFDSQVKAATAIPYTLAHLPVNAEIAKKRLKTGDFVSFNAHMNFVLSRGSSWPIAEYLDFSAGASYVMSGQFQVHVFKLSDSKVRVKVIGLRTKSAGVSGNMKFAPAFDIFGVNLLDNQVERFFKLNILNGGTNANLDNLYMVDYMMDLSNSEVALAYNSLMKAGLKFKSLKIANPFNSEEKLNDELVHDIDVVDDLFKEDRMRPREQRRVDRIFEGKTTVESRGSRIKANLKIWKGGKSTTYSKNKIQSVNRNDEKQNYLFNAYLKERESRFAFDFFRKSVKEGMSVLLSAFNDFSTDRFKELHFSYHVEDANFTGNNREKMLKILNRKLSKNIVAEIGIDQWLNADDKNQNNAYLKYNVTFTEKSLGMVPDYSMVELAEKIDQYLSRYPELKSYMGWSTDQTLMETTYSHNNLPALKEDLALRLSQAFSSSISADERTRIFLSLRTNVLFYEIGPGLLMSLIPEKDLREVVGVRLEAGAKEISAFDQYLGAKIDRDLYNTVQYIQSVINNRSQDLSLIIDDNSGEYRAQ